MEALTPYSSIDDDHIVLVYQEYATGAWEREGMAFRHRTLYNKMFVMINKNTNLVDEFCYREEFRPR